MNSNPLNKKQLHNIIDFRMLTETAFVIRFERNNLEFIPGQYLNIGTESSLLEREYSIYSGIHDPFLEILVREVPGGDVSPGLRQLKPGQKLRLSGPYGSMVLADDKINHAKFIFIASGTGIAPFRSYARSYPVLDYQLIHGVRFSKEAYDKQDYSPDRYILCTSGDTNAHYAGRVTSFLKENEIDTQSLFYVCGNSSMIYEVYDILREKGVGAERMFSEVYF